MSIFDKKSTIISDLKYNGFPDYFDYKSLDVGYWSSEEEIMPQGWLWERVDGNMIDMIGIESIGIVICENIVHKKKFDVKICMCGKKDVDTLHFTDYIHWENLPLNVAKNMGYSTMKKFKEPGCIQDLISQMKNREGYFYKCYRKHINRRRDHRDPYYRSYDTPKTKLSFSDILGYRNEHI